MICDLWRLEVEEGWRLLDLNPMIKKIYMLKLHKTYGCGCVVDSPVEETRNKSWRVTTTDTCVSVFG